MRDRGAKAATGFTGLGAESARPSFPYCTMNVFVTTAGRSPA